MKLTSLSGSALLLAALTIPSFSSAIDIITRCRGGSEGPKPMMDITSDFHTHTRVLRTIGSVKEFLYWPARNQLVYRNSKHEVRSLGLGGMGLSWYWGKSQSPLARVPDPSERFLLGNKTGSIFDTSSGAKSWQTFGPSSDEMEHLYWNDDSLYSLDQLPYTSGLRRFDFHRYDPVTGKSVSICSWSTPTSGHYKLAHGHTFPYVFFYTINSNRMNHWVTVDRLNIEACEVDVTWDYSEVPIEEKIKDVYRFEDRDSTAILINRPDDNVLYDDRGFCTFVDADDFSVIPLSAKDPIFALWSKTRGLHLMYVQKDVAKRASVLSNFKLASVSREDFSLTEDAGRLYFSPAFVDDNFRWVMEVQLLTKVR